MKESKTKVMNFDSLLNSEEKKRIAQLEKISKSEDLCPEAAKAGKFFYFCRKGYASHALANSNPVQSEVYRRKLSSLELEFYCLKGYTRCGCYLGKSEK